VGLITSSTVGLSTVWARARMSTGFAGICMRSTRSGIPAPRCLTTFKHLRAAAHRLTGQTHQDSVIARIAADLVDRIGQLTIDIDSLTAELDARTSRSAPNLRQIHGVAGVSAAKLVGEVAAVARFRSRHAFARHNGTAPTPVWSGNTERHRLSPAGNRQLNAALHRIALTQARSHPQARAYLTHRAEQGATRKEAIRSLKRRLSDIVYRAMLADAQTATDGRHRQAA
jgi:transposase